MITNKIKIFFLFLLTFLVVKNTFSQINDKKINRVLFVFDASQSMLSRWDNGQKIERAKKLLINILDSLDSQNINNLELALRVYGHQYNFPPQICEDSRLEVDFSPLKTAIKNIKTKLNLIKARGTTAIGYSIEQAANDFQNIKGDSRNIIILITDGQEECDIDPCRVSKRLQKKGIFLKPFIIGIGADDYWKKSFDCVGELLDATYENQFKNVLNIIFSNIIDNTTTQVYLLDQDNKPTETNVDIRFYNTFTDELDYHYVHTLNKENIPDTMMIENINSYNMIINTIPPIHKEFISIDAGKHNIIEIDAHQGKLNIQMFNNKKKYNCLIRKAGEKEIINIQEINSTVKYLKGRYEIEILTLPKYYDTIYIDAGLTYNLPLPSTGKANIFLPSKGYGGLYFISGNIIEKIYEFKGEKTRHNLELLPNRKYKVVFRALSSYDHTEIREKEFTIKSNKTESIKLY